MGASKFGTICPKHERAVQVAPDDFLRPPRGNLDTRGNLENSPSPPLQFPSLTNRWAIHRSIFFLDDRPMRPLDINSTRAPFARRIGSVHHQEGSRTCRLVSRTRRIAHPPHIFFEQLSSCFGRDCRRPGGRVALRNASKAFSTEVDCSCVVLSSHSLAAVKRNRPVRVAAAFPPPTSDAAAGRRVLTARQIISVVQQGLDLTPSIFLCY